MIESIASTFGIAGLAGVLIGAQLAKQVDGDALLMWFAVAMIANAGSILIPKKSEGDPAVRLIGPMVLKLAPVGLFGGATSPVLLRIGAVDLAVVRRACHRARRRNACRLTLGQVA